MARAWRSPGEHASTHGQQFWLLEQLCKKRQDGTECEAVLWDLAGQPDYRLIHALFLDDADLALGSVYEFLAMRKAATRQTAAVKVACSLS